MLTLERFEEASKIVREVTLETKLIYSDFLSEQTGNKVYLKPENMQFTGAYKVRGAYYKMSTLTEEERENLYPEYFGEESPNPAEAPIGEKSEPVSILTAEEEQGLQDEAMSAAKQCMELYKEIEIAYPETEYRGSHCLFLGNP